MATQLRERIYSPLSPSDARELVKEVQARLDELAEGPHDDEEGMTELDVLDDVSMFADESLPPDARGAKDVVERAAKCRSAVTIDYYGRIYETTAFIALEKAIVAGVGAALVWRGEAGEEPGKGAKLVTIEAFVKAREHEVGPKWRKTLALGTIEEIERKPIRTRDAKAGELEALAVHKRLARMIEGNDPFARDALKKALEQTTPQVRAYAAALMENGPTADAALSKELDMSPREVASARDELGALLKAIR
jgi:hypothetical protein